MRVVQRLQAAMQVQLGPGCIPVRSFLKARAAGRVEIENDFFAGLRLRSGVFKTTGATRLDDVLEPLVRHVGHLAPGPVRVLDVGCSSGETTVALHLALAARGLAPLTWGTDLMTSARHVLRDDGCGLLFDPDGQVIQVDVGSWATSWFWPPRKFDIVRRPLRVARALDLLHRQSATFRKALTQPVAGMAVSTVPLVSSTVDAASGVEVVEEDLLAPVVPGSFQVIRVANVLNLVYFSEHRIREMAQAVVSRLADGGVLMVTRSNAGHNDGTIYRRDGDSLQRVEDMNGGSEVAHLMDARISSRGR